MPRIMDTKELMRNAPFELSHADKEVLATTEEDFIPHTWEDFQNIIGEGDSLEYEIQATFGSVTNFLVRKRLHWEEAANNDQIRFPYRHSVPFSNHSDYRIRRNDWPYAIAPGMVHLVVWLKTPIPVDAQGDPTTESRRLIADFIERTCTMHTSQ
ncbi:hypothetical protein ANOM_011778 [Aspergillus nomiae NRRL 13137]|uniref:Uncharacterized protein n=1 Tax=Aspergillus nomiae NRRL (strain ATCC 15546 / NRRL 13137 / CBS 260.88 / M93) TaxID=1509407 RepID=A0A0L1IKS2_ASPN3|nr:uncharacterized protein ANOM_011778 [Aspergillus nomiae NRRL 13137]KNG79865.1 hypothetical protein ANOM_011778 [Aspergillus nomiae NRRL 13137]